MTDAPGGGPPADDRAAAVDAEIDRTRRELLWGTDERLTVAEIAARAGLDEDLLRHARLLLGLADPGDVAACVPDETELFSALGVAIELFGADLALQYVRVLGTAIGTV